MSKRIRKTKVVKCKFCGLDFTCDLNLKRTFCSYKCKADFQKGKDAWNKGLRKASDERVLCSANKRSKTMSEKSGDVFYGEKEERECSLESCHNIFLVRPDSKRKYCSPKCYHEDTKGRVVSFETREKHRMISTGRKHSEETKKKLSQKKKGKLVKQFVEYLSSKKVKIEERTCALPGCSNIFKERMTSKKKYCSHSCYAKALIGTNHTEEHKLKISKSGKGKKRSKETCDKISKALKGKYVGIYVGEKACNWQGGLSKMPYPFNFNEELKSLIRKRDDNICQLCGKNEQENKKRLAIHHIDYIKENLNPENLITLCTVCNSKVNGNRKSWMAFFQNKMKLTKNWEEAECI